MSTQSEFEANYKANTAKWRAADNARSAAKKAEDEKKALNNQLNKSITDITQRIIGPATKDLLAAEVLVNQYQSAYNAYVRAHKNEPGYPSGSDTTTLNQILSLLAPHQAVVAKKNLVISNAEAQIKTIRKQLTDANPLLFPTSLAEAKKKLTAEEKKKKDKTAPKGEKKAFSADYKYNAPMVNSAYFGMENIQSRLLDGNHVDQGNFTDARQAWQGVQGGRGTIQMDKKFLQSFTSTDFADSKFDLQKYGFKFLYNPNTVSMAWGLMNSMDPTFQASQLDKFQVVSTALMSSTVSFELVLNRIADFNYLDETGLRPSAKSPYPLDVSPEDLKEIYQKGTMYDLEYFFKTVNGPSGTFVSGLNGSTADRAWMRPQFVELHLGNAMRYRVRIGEFAVNHIMFNDRMVPIFSSVKITCSRMNDGPETTTGSGVGTNGQLYGISDPAKLAGLTGNR